MFGSVSLIPADLISIQALYDYKTAGKWLLDRAGSFQFKHCTIISPCSACTRPDSDISIQALYDYKKIPAILMPVDCKNFNSSIVRL